MKKLFILFSLLTTLVLSGCASTALKAPCNYSASDCGAKIKINQWNSNSI